LVFIYGLWAAVLAADLMLPALAWGDPPEVFYACLWGFLLGQSGLISGWTALGPGRVLPRVLLLAGVGITAVACFLIGIKLHSPAALSDNVPWDLFVWCPLAFVVLTAPLWLVRYLANWRIVRVNQAGAASTLGRQYGIGHLLACTAVVAAALGLPRAGRAGSIDELPMAMMTFITLALLVTIAILPGVRCVLSVRSWFAGITWLGVSAVVMCAVVFIACVAIAAYADPPLGSLLYWLLTLAEDAGPIIAGVVLAGYATVGIGASAWRLAGYRLARGKGRGG